MVVFGIDPGSNVTGYGVVTTARGRFHLVDAGAVRTDRRATVAERLKAIFEGLGEALDRHPIDAVAIEGIFRHKSSESALRLGQARGIALLCAAQRGHDPHEYNPMTVKRTVGAHGGADKDAVAKMVRMLLGQPDLAGPADVTDAIAIAITHCSFARSGLRQAGVVTK